MHGKEVSKLTSTTNPTHTETYIADGAVTKHALVIKGTGANQVKMPTGAGGAVIGVAQHAAASGEQVSVAVLGPSMAVASAAVAIGAKVANAGTTGKTVTAAASAGANIDVVGTALTAAAADGDIHKINVCPSVMQGA